MTTITPGPDLAELDTSRAYASLAPPIAAPPPFLTMYDASTPPASPPHTDIVLVYAGGNTPHVWTGQEIEAQRARYYLPAWVARDLGAGAGAGAGEARQMLRWLSAMRAPRGCVTVLDIEAAAADGPDLAYFHAYRDTLAQAGGWVMLYGSISNVFGYPLPGGGYFVANPPPEGIPAKPHMYLHRGVTATQWRFAVEGEPWDLSVVAEAVRPHLWDRQWTGPALAEAQHLAASASALVRILRDYQGARS